MCKYTLHSPGSRCTPPPSLSWRETVFNRAAPTPSCAGGLTGPHRPITSRLRTEIITPPLTTTGIHTPLPSLLSFAYSWNPPRGIQAQISAGRLIVFSCPSLVSEPSPPFIFPPPLLSTGRVFTGRQHPSLLFSPVLSPLRGPGDSRRRRANSSAG